MEAKPTHYDGSGQINFDQQGATEKETFQMTDEVRKNIGGNPYVFEITE